VYYNRGKAERVTPREGKIYSDVNINYMVYSNDIYLKKKIKKGGERGK
jgi:hypothetical protein